MKNRQGFVSNSSTSSFICQICNRVCEEEESFVEEPRIRGCVNDHVFCDRHTLPDYENILNFEYNENWGEHDGEDLYESLYMNIPEEYCPICQLAEIPDLTLLEFLFKLTGIDKETAKDIYRKEHTPVHDKKS
jgi:hypothetical protein